MIRPSTHSLAAGDIDPQRQHRNRRRLAKVLDLARIYRGLGVKELADRLRRDKTRLIPETGNPKIDLVASLAEALEWPLPDVVEAILGRRDPMDNPLLRGGRDFEELEEMVERAHAAGHRRAVVAIGKALAMKAEDPRQSATSCYWQGLGAESRGLYQDAQNHFREGLNLPYEHARTRILLRINLANAYRLHGGLLEARTIVSEVIGDVRAGETRASQHFNRSMLAFALFVRGDAARRRLVGEYSEQTLEEAVVDLERAESILGQSRRLGHSSANDCVARGCRGALIELGAISGRFTTEEALEQMRGQREATDSGREGTEPKESQGWWSDFEANIAWCGLSGRNRIDTTLEHAERLVEIGAHLEHFGLQDAGFRWLLKIHQASETRAG